MYYNEKEDYIDDIIDFVTKDGTKEKKLLKGFYVNYKGSKTPVKINGLKSAWIIDKNRT
jgi:hypothetical protein